MILYAPKYLRPWPASHHPQNLRECCLHSHTINVSWTNQQIHKKNKPATRPKIWETPFKPPSSMVLNPRCILESPGSLYTGPIPRSALIRISGTGTILKFFKWCWYKTRNENHCSRPELSHRPFCNDGNGLPLCCPIQQSLVTCGYWALEMQLEQLRNLIFNLILLKYPDVACGYHRKQQRSRLTSDYLHELFRYGGTTSFQLILSKRSQKRPCQMPWRSQLY